jgi:integrase
MLVPAETRKGKTRDRRYRLSPVTSECLNAIRGFNPDKKEVFPWPYAANYIWDKYRRVLRRAGLPTGRKYMLHCLRKTVGSAVHAAGLNAQDVLDHADKRTTRRYLDPRFTREDQPCDVLAVMLANPTRKKTTPAAPDRLKSG